MSVKRSRDLCARLGLSAPCDLHLLVFFHRHPRAVLPSERLALYVGFDIAEVAKSLDTLIAAGLLTRVQGPTRSGRMYLLTSSGPSGGWIDALLRLASTRQGRVAVLTILAEREPDSPTPGGPTRTTAGNTRRQQAMGRAATEVRHA